MSSALLANGNESGSVQATVGFMGKSPYLNPNPPKKVKRSHQKANTGCGQDDVNVLPAIIQTASDDAYSFNQKPIGNNRLIEFNQVDLVTFHVAGCSNMELSDIRRRLVSELEKIRNLRDRIELANLSGKTCDPNDQAKSKKFAGNKRSAPVASKKNLSNGFDDWVMDKGLIKECKQILNKLMKHKCAWIFNKPVDTAGLELHDYLQIVKHPMDLGTVRSNLSNNTYSSPGDFAADVRLTFNNALFYNPKTDEVHQWAEMLLSRFEDLFRPIQEKISIGQREYFNGGDGGGVVEDLQECPGNQNLTFDEVNKPKLSTMARRKERMQSQSSASSMSNPLPPVNPSKAQSPVQTTPLKRGPKPRPPKQPKPKAKDPNKREMSMEEKQKLGFELQSMPQEKIVQLVHIIKKRNAYLAEDGDEIELDIESLDKETLWELDRFSTNWKKMVSKSKRQALMNNDGHVADTSTAELDDRDASNDGADILKNKKCEVGDEDIDIDDDVPASNFPAVEIEKDVVVGHDGGGIADEVVGQDGGWDADEVVGQYPGNNADEVVGQNHGNASCSSSSSSGSSSDSSSSSDSGSSSGSDDSDADDVQS